MQGIELSRQFFKEHGLPMIMEEFGEYKDRIAAGLVGHGSECFGFDDRVSADHDFDAGFCIWLTPEDEKLFGFKLFRAYRKLPKEYKGIAVENKSIYGTSHKGVHTIPEFYSVYTGCDGAPTDAHHWLSIPSHYLAEATNGEVFYDPLGEFTKIRNVILKDMPQDVWLKRLASKIITAAQSGQYNYPRCLAHGEKGAAQLALVNFATAAAETAFILNRRHAPYYKWLFRAGKALPVMGQTVCEIEALLTEELTDKQRIDKIESISSKLISALIDQNYTNNLGDFLEPYAYAVNDKIKDGQIRNLPIFQE